MIDIRFNKYDAKTATINKSLTFTKKIEVIVIKDDVETALRTTFSNRENPVTTNTILLENLTTAEIGVLSDVLKEMSVFVLTLRALFKTE